MSARINWHARSMRFRNMAAECRSFANSWPDADVATSFANAAAELETAANAMLERYRK